MPIQLPIGRSSLSTIPTYTRLNKYANQRRSQRVMLSIRILVSGERIGGQRFSEETLTSVVNAHGALILLGENVSTGQAITIRNVKSGEELQGEVVEVGSEQAGKSEVGVEFLEPSPRFWRIAFPPEDWSPRNPEAKRAVLQTAPVALPKPRLSK
jgi:hypothetical protein